MTFSRARGRPNQLRAGYGSGLLERTRPSDFFLTESGTFKGVRAREARKAMLAGATVFVQSAGAALPDPDFSWSPESAETPPAALSFTRATSDTVLTTTDGATYWYQTAKASEMRFKKLRRVENLFPSDGRDTDLTVGWSAASGATIDSATQFSFPGIGGGERIFVLANNRTSSSHYCVAVKVSRTSGSSEIRLIVSGLTPSSTRTVTVGATPTIIQIAGMSGSTSPTITIQQSSSSPASGVFNFEFIQQELVQVGGDQVFGGHVRADTTYNAIPDGGSLPGVKYFATANGNSVDGNGVVTEADGLALTGGGYLSQPQVTNQMVRSDVNNAAWTKTGLTPTSDGINSHGLQQTTLDAGTGTSAHFLTDDAATGSAGCGWFLAKAGTAQFVTVFRGGDATTDYAAFDLTNGTVTEEGAGIDKAFIEDEEDGWYKIGVTTSDADATLELAISDSGTPGTHAPSFTGSNETLLVCHAQYTATRRPTSPIVTSGSAVTRSQDLLTYSGVTSAEPYTASMDSTFPVLVGSSSSEITPLFQFASSSDRVAVYDNGSNTTFDLIDASASLAATLNLPTANYTIPEDRYVVFARMQEDNALLSVQGEALVEDLVTGPVAAGDMGIGYAGSAGHSGIIHKVEIWASGVSP